MIANSDAHHVPRIEKGEDNEKFDCHVRLHGQSNFASVRNSKHLFIALLSFLKQRMIGC
jgi:hypothetical protein